MVYTLTMNALTHIFKESGQLINFFILIGMLVVGVRFYDSIATKNDVALSILDLQINQTNKEITKLDMINELGGELSRFDKANKRSLENELAELKSEKERILTEQD